MNIPLPVLFFIAMLILGIERIIPLNLPPWVAGVLLVIVGFVGLLGAT